MSAAATNNSSSEDNCAAADSENNPLPGLVDGGGEGVVVEHRHGAEVGERLHHRERDTGGERRPRHRQRGMPERAPRA